VIDALYGHDSPYRPGEGLDLGLTPVPKTTLPMGSYLLILHKEGFEPVRIPVRVNRMQHGPVSVTLYGEGEVPEGFVLVSGGHFNSQGDRPNPYSGDKVVLRTEDVFLARFPITCAEYRDFLNALAVSRPEEASKRVPRRTPSGGAYWPRDPEGAYHVPTEELVTGSPGSWADTAAKLEVTDVWWREDWPVFGVSWDDLLAYAAWRSRDDRRFTLPHSHEWEKAARGVDGRAFTWGNEFVGAYCNFKGSFPDGMRPAPVDSFPADESPYGVRGQSGNVKEASQDGVVEREEYRIWQGGAWPATELMSRVTTRTAFPREAVYFYAGGRLAWRPRLPDPAPGRLA
jgi:serine/threonine-protein kinase